MWRYMPFARSARPACPHSALGCYFYLLSLTGTCTSSFDVLLGAVRARSCPEEVREQPQKERLCCRRIWEKCCSNSISSGTHESLLASNFPLDWTTFLVSLFSPSTLGAQLPSEFHFTLNPAILMDLLHITSSLFLPTPQKHSDSGPYFTTRPLLPMYPNSSLDSTLLKRPFLFQPSIFQRLTI